MATARPPNFDNTSRPLNMSLCAFAGAISRASIDTAPSSPCFLVVMNAPPPIPAENMVFVAPMHKQVVTAASAANPPFLRISTPSCEQRAESDATPPWEPRAVKFVCGFQVGPPIKGTWAGYFGRSGGLVEHLAHHLHVVSWHDLFGVVLLRFWESQSDTDVGGSHKHLWSVVLGEWSVSSSLLLGQNVHGGQELLVGLEGANLGKNHTSLKLLSLNTSQQNTWSVSSHSLVKLLVVHFDTSHCGLERSGVLASDNLNFLTLLQHTSLDSTRNNSTSTRDREDFVDRQQKWLLKVPDRCWNVLVHSIHQFLDGLLSDLWLSSFQSTQRRSHDDRGLVTVKAIRTQKLSHFHLNKLQHLWVINGVDLVDEDNQLLNTNLSSKQQVLSSLRHLSIRSSNNNDSTVHLSSTSNHVLDVILMARTVNVRIVSVRSFVLNVCSRDGDTSSTLFWGLVNGRVVQKGGTSVFRKHLGDGSRQSGFAVIHMADGTNVDVGLGSIESSSESDKRVAEVSSNSAHTLVEGGFQQRGNTFTFERLELHVLPIDLAHLFSQLVDPLKFIYHQLLVLGCVNLRVELLGELKATTRNSVAVSFKADRQNITQPHKAVLRYATQILAP
ncbi:hypothetical protein OGATHE_003635 [Ogataea polymorpha]|uniref:Uncharacterized protein n=1 Tax=Ogataea polymorpha TaxID=460523 RepID=A0A9P8T492_9ASCO|nr:hypothetical protein OGATHE_003635 [Ogataea polymorpha]